MPETTAPLEHLLHIGAVTSSTARIWVRGNKTETVTITLYGHSNNTEVSTINVQTAESEVYCNVAEFTNLHPDTSYWCSAEFDGASMESGVFKTFPSTADEPFSFMISSCNFNRDVFGDEQSKAAFDGLNKVREDYSARFMIHAGDQVYADVIELLPIHIKAKDYKDAYERTWCNGNAQQFFASIPNYMILDDHELRNDFDQSNTYNSEVLESGLNQYYFNYQHKHNPETPAGQYWYTFNYGNVAFFVMDIRTERYSTSGKMISELQHSALLNWMDANRSNKKFIVSPVPFLTEVKESGAPNDKWCGIDFVSQRTRIVEHILQEGHQNVVFLSGDMHSINRSNVKLTKLDKTIHCWEFLAGPINQAVVNGADFFESETSTVEIPHVTVEYDCQTFSDKIRLPGNVAKFANVLLVKVEQDYLTFTWKAIQQNPQVEFKTVKINLVTHQEVITDPSED